MASGCPSLGYQCFDQLRVLGAGGGDSSFEVVAKVEEFGELSDDATLLDQLHAHDGQSLGQLCEHLNMTRQGVTQYLDVLEAANLQDFPVAALDPHQIEATSDDFVLNQLELRPYEALGAVKKMRARLTRPPLSAAELIAARVTRRLYPASATSKSLRRCEFERAAQRRANPGQRQRAAGRTRRPGGSNWVPRLPGQPPGHWVCSHGT